MVLAGQTSERALAEPGPAKDGRARALPIVVDLDATLLLTDTLHESLLAACFANPLALAQAAPHLLSGRAAFKAALAGRVPEPARTLPLREDLVAWLRGQAAGGREVHLCSAAHQNIVDAIAERVGIFTSAIGSGTLNLKGRAKADHLAARFPDGFTYAGDSRADLPVWQAAQGIVLAGPSPAVAAAARALGKPVEAEFENDALGWKDWLKLLRVHHWSKNALIFVPLVLGNAWSDPAVIGRTALGLACLLMVTSGTYLINDLADLDADRRHWSKRTRALASGRLPVAYGAALAAGLLGLGFLAAAILLPASFTLVLASYAVLTLGYSFGLKRVPLLDTLIIGILFTTRLVMGIALLGQPYSEWLLTFSMFFFFSLAIAKRHTEIVRAGSSESHSLAARGYRVEDGPLTLMLGVATSVASLLIMVLFLVEEVFKRNQYGNPKALWAIPVILAIWVGRVWLLSHRGEMSDDPVSFALRDKVSLLLGGAVAAAFLLAL